MEKRKLTKTKVIPKFDNLDEMAEFWDNNSSAEYWDQMTATQENFKRLELKPVSLKLDPHVLAEIKILARQKGLSYNAYIRFLLAEKVAAEHRIIHKQ